VGGTRIRNLNSPRRWVNDPTDSQDAERDFEVEGGERQVGMFLVSKDWWRKGKGRDAEEEAAARLNTKECRLETPFGVRSDAQLAFGIEPVD
jgi:hypothetical protein